MLTRTIETTTHGRYLFEDRGPDRLLVGFHGYAETADLHFAELEKIPGIERWSVVSVQALHPFYTRAGQAVASWMTSVDRELAIGDNIAYVQRVLAVLPRPRSLVFIGFSQGASMAARAAAHTRAGGLILLGGDIPPEVKSNPTVALPAALVARGETDDWYTDEKFKNDLKYLEPMSAVRSLTFAGGHEWTDEFRSAAGRFLASFP